jgi:fatty-acyl-CoA synthase
MEVCMTKLNRSYMHGTGTTPLTSATLGDLLEAGVAAHPDQLVLVSRAQGIRWTWRELARRVDAFAAGLLALQLRPGERIAIWANNRAEWLIAQLAAAKAGLILVNINPAARRGEVQQFLNLVEASALIVQDRFKTSDYIAMVQEIVPELAQAEPGRLSCAAVPSLRLVIQLGEAPVPGMLAFSEVAERALPEHQRELAETAARVQCDDPVNIQFSSAAGGKPAAATLSHHNIVNNGFFVGQTLRLGASDRVCLPVPLFHCFGMVMGNLACLTHGSTIVYPGEGFDPAETLATVAAERCTALYGVPAMFAAVLDHERFAEHDLSSLRTGIMAGAPCPIETMRRVVRDMHMEQVTIAYGMTETSPVSFMSDIDDSLERRVSTVGTIRPHTEAKVIDAEGRIVPPGTVGELCTRGYNVMLGYWNEPARTAQVIDAAGWMHTGDLARLDDEGYCNIAGGLKDMVIRGGENVYPAEIEEFLLTHPSIAEAVVVGVPDARLGEEICACLRLQPGAELSEAALRAFCQDQIAHYKIPRYVRCYPQFPASTGRALKFLLRQQVMAELRLKEAQTA